MKKLISIVVLATLLTALCACSAKSNVPVNEPVSSESIEVTPVTDNSEVVPAPGEDVTRGEAYVGVWGCGRCTITIDPVSDRYEVQVTWASSAAEHTYWTYECYYDEATGHLRGENGVRTNVLTNDDGSEKEDVVYEDGVCEFHITIDGELVWEDKEDGVGDGMYFQKN